MLGRRVVCGLVSADRHPHHFGVVGFVRHVEAGFLVFDPAAATNVLSNTLFAIRKRNTFLFNISPPGERRWRKGCSEDGRKMQGLSCVPHAQGGPRDREILLQPMLEGFSGGLISTCTTMGMVDGFRADAAPAYFRIFVHCAAEKRGPSSTYVKISFGKNHKKKSLAYTRPFGGDAFIWKEYPVVNNRVK